MVSNMDAGFLIIDYRGFADSSPVPPTEAGLVLDLRAAWDHLTVLGVRGTDITVMAQSLGTGVSSKMVSELAREGMTPRALVLVAPYSSIGELLSTYRLGNLIPLLGPLRNWKRAMNYFLPLLTTRYETHTVIADIKCPILLLHAQDDPGEWRSPFPRSPSPVADSTSRL